MNWTKSKLSDIAQLVMGQSPESLFYNSEGRGMKFLQGCAEFGDKFPLAITFSTSIKKIAPKNSILFSVRAPVGKINFADDEYCIGRGLASIIPTKCDLEFLYQVFLYLQIQTKFVSQGSTFDSINSTELSEIEIQHPESKPEQTRIAQILSTADAAIAQTEALIAKYQRIKTGLMQDLLTRGIDEKGNIRSKATHRFVVKNGMEVPEEWSVPFFGDTIELVHGYQFRNYDFTIHGLPVVKISQVKPEGLDMSSCSYISENRLDAFEKQRIKNGDVLMALTGATLGKACFVQGLVGEALQNYRVGRFEPLLENDVDKTYLYYVLTTKEFLNQIFNKVNAGAQGNIGKADFEKAFIAKPPFNEQVNIAKTLLQITSLLEKEIEKRNKLQSLKTGLMQDLLSGKVRVKIKEAVNAE